MNLIRGLYNLQPAHHGCVLAIGNFDGVHRGHQALLAGLRETARKLRLPVMVMIFEPQPLELFAAEQAPARLTRLREKVHYLAQYGVDRVLCVRFSRQFATMTAQQFIDDLLIKKLGVKFLCVGDDFRFGAQRLGDFAMLQQAARDQAFEVMQSHTFCDGGIRISSTAVRQALKDNDLLLAERLLGHPFMISGRVAHGEELGHTLGFPTANLPLHRQVCPIQGVFAVEVSGPDFQRLPAVANIGTRPTVSGTRQQLEVHLLNINLDLYGSHLEVTLRHKLRDEQRFASLDALKKQIARDAQTAREFFGLTAPLSSHEMSSHAMPSHAISSQTKPSQTFPIHDNDYGIKPNE